MRVAICDDEACCREHVVELIKLYISQNKKNNLSFYTFSHAEELLEAVFKNGDFDIYILDIIMPGMNGIELGRELRDNGYEGKIVYLTSSVEFAVDSYSVKAFNYILKPIQKDKFFAVLSEIIQLKSEKNDRTVIVRTKESSVKIKIDSIMYAERSGRSVIYHLANGRSVESVSIRTKFIDAVSELLHDRCFVPGGASMVVNMHHITAVENEAIIFCEGNKVHLGVKACREVRSAWIDFCINEEADKCQY